MGKQQKYVAVNSHLPEEVETLPQKRFFTPFCFWTSLRTIILLGIYFGPSIGLTFYQRWLLQVNIKYLFYISYKMNFNIVTTNICYIFAVRTYLLT